jgi:hypothetical protein
LVHGLASRSVGSIRREEIIGSGIHLDPHILVLIEQALIVHLPGDRPHLARLEDVEAQAIDATPESPRENSPFERLSPQTATDVKG